MFCVAVGQIITRNGLKRQAEQGFSSVSPKFFFAIFGKKTKKILDQLAFNQSLNAAASKTQNPSFEFRVPESIDHH